MSMTKSATFIAPLAALLDIQENTGAITATTPDSFVKSVQAKSQIAGWLRANPTWANEYFWLLKAYFLEMKSIDAND